MPKKGFIIRNIKHTIAIVEKEIFLKFRFKASIIHSLINPLIQLVIIFFIFGAVFNLGEGITFGYWNKMNYVLFLLIAFCVQFSRPITERYPQSFTTEKYWKTLSATMIAPIHRFSLLLGILISQIILNSIGVTILVAIAYFLYPISLSYFLLFILVYFCIVLCFGSIGLIIGAFAIGNENWVSYYTIVLRFIFLFSCINYPKEIFPEFFQIFITLNPLYYYFDLLRLLWYLGLEPELAILYITPYHITIFLSITIIAPIISVLLFNFIYKKYGIIGY